ncbi:MAG: HAD-IA family hydrolase [Methanomassiliicoccales archaeon]
MDFEIKECFFFDAGNTLMFLYPSREHILQEVLADHGVQVTLSQLKVGFMLTDVSIEDYTLMTGEQRQELWRRFTGEVIEGAGLDGGITDQAARDLAERFASHESWAPFSDVVPTLESLRDSGCRLGVISNAESNLRDILKGLDLLDYFDIVVISEEVGVEKPDPGIFQAALEEVNLPPERCVHTGDLVKLDVRGAQARGMTGVWLDREKLACDPGVTKIHSLSELSTSFRLPSEVHGR